MPEPRVEWGNTQYTLIAKVYPFEGGASSITVYRSACRAMEPGGELSSAVVNWPAIGSVLVERAALFIKGLSLACVLARVMNGDIRRYRVSGYLCNGDSWIICGNNEGQVR